MVISKPPSKCPGWPPLTKNASHTNFIQFAKNFSLVLAKVQCIVLNKKEKIFVKKRLIIKFSYMEIVWLAFIWWRHQKFRKILKFLQKFFLCFFQSQTLSLLSSVPLSLDISLWDLLLLILNVSVLGGGSSNISLRSSSIISGLRFPWPWPPLEFALAKFRIAKLSLDLLMPKILVFLIRTIVQSWESYWLCQMISYGTIVREN